MLSAVTVTTSADSGPGSFRNAVEQANNDSDITSIIFRPQIQTVQLLSTVTYEGEQDLSIDGNTVNIQPTPSLQGDIDLFVSDGGADLSLQEITFRNGRNGVIVDVPLTVTGEVEVTLDRVTIANNDLFGLHIIDLTETPEEEEIGSDASMVLRIENSTITGNGTGAHDQDGVRVDERGAGAIAVSISHSQLNGNGAEGVELDEGGDGSVFLTITHSSFNGNGFIPLTDETDPEFPDFDDGIDVDEADAGNVNVAISHSTANGNFDEGIDLNEGDFGDLNLVMNNVRMTGNTDEGLALEETGEGGIRAALFAIHAADNGADGLQFEEFDEGDVEVDIANSVIINNGGFGIFASQQAPGTGRIRLRNVSLRRNADGAFNTMIDNEETEDPDDQIPSGVVITKV